MGYINAQPKGKTEIPAKAPEPDRQRGESRREMRFFSSLLEKLTHDYSFTVALRFAAAFRKETRNKRAKLGYGSPIRLGVKPG